MNINELRAEMGRKNLSIPKLSKLTGIDKNTLYRRFDGYGDFKQSEISAIAKVLDLSDEKILNIFFAKEVS